MPGVIKAGRMADPMVRVSHPGRAWLVAEQQRQRRELGRYVSFAEIVDQLIRAAERRRARHDDHGETAGAS